MQKHSTLLINQLARNGCELTVVHPGGSGYSQTALENVFSEFAKIEFILVPFPKFKKLPGHYIRENIKYSKRVFHEIKKISNHHFDLIYCQGLTGYYFVLNKTNQQPVIINLHGYGEFFSPPSMKLKLQYAMLRPIMKKISLHADYVYSFGGRIADLLISMGINRDKILTQFNGIESSFITQNVLEKRSTGKLKFVYIGRNERRKGIEEIKAAVIKLNLKFPDRFDFHFIGEGTNNIKLDFKNVFLHGQKSELKEIFSVIDDCDCIVLPSYAEGMPMVIIEAMARGLIVIVSDVGASSELIKDNGILLKAPSDLLAAMENLLVTPEVELIQMKKNSVKLVNEKYNLQHMIDSVIHDFKMILAR